MYKTRRFRQNKKNKIMLCKSIINRTNRRFRKTKTRIKKYYPDYEIIEDIGSGINLTKKGILKIINLSIEGKIEELVISYKDRLARFGYDLLEYIIKKYSNGKITIINKKEEQEPEEELVKDVLQKMNVFVAKINGRRKYKNK
jgi:putative resolvase